MAKERRKRGENPEPEHTGPSFQDIIQKALDEIGPKLDAFEKNISELQNLYQAGEITETEFFQKLIDDSPVVGTFLDLGDWQLISITRTEDNKIEILPGNYMSSVVPARIKTIIGVDSKGVLEIDSEVEWEGEEKPSKQPVIPSDMVGFGVSVEAVSFNRIYALLGFELEEEDQIDETVDTIGPEDREELGSNPNREAIFKFVAKHFGRAQTEL